MNLSIIGTGYVGLTLAIALTKVGHTISCYDINDELINDLKNGKTEIKEPEILNYLNEGINKNKLFFYKYNDQINLDDVVIITVGTNIKNGSSNIYKNRIYEIIENCILSKVKFLFLRSTVGVGFVDSLYRKWGKEINFLYSPERTIEGNAIEELFNLPQIIACKNIISKNIAKNIFQPLNVKLLFTDKFVEAELAKLLCNIYRDYNFAFSNQTAILCRDLSINISKVSDLASTDYKRFPELLPGPVSGPCLSKDIKILAENSDIKKNCNLFLNARHTNENIINLIAEDIKSLLKEFNLSKILIMGISFKSYPPVGDTRDSHAIDLAKKLFNINCQLFFHDPIVDKAGKEFINGREIENYLDIDIDLLVFPVIPYWYGNKNIENFFFEKFISKKRYWLYKPNLFPSNGEDYVFGEYNK